MAGASVRVSVRGPSGPLAAAGGCPDYAPSLAITGAWSEAIIPSFFFL